MKANDLLDMLGDVDESFIAEAKRPGERLRSQWTRWVAAAACLCLITFAYNPGGIMTYAKTILNSFALHVGSSQVELSETIPMDFDVESFKQMPGVQRVTGSEEADDEFYVFCDDADELKKYAEIHLTSSEEIIFRNIGLHLSGKNQNGHLSMDIYDESGACTAAMNGQFILAGNENSDSMGYGYDLGKIKSTYKCKNGTEAYFIEDEQAGDKQIVIFVVDGIQYQLFVENTKEAATFAKSVLDLMCDF